MKIIDPHIHMFSRTTDDYQRMAAAGIVTKWGADRVLVNSSADWGESDPLSVLATIEEMKKLGLSDADIEKVVYRNPIEFYSQSPNFRRP